MKSHTRVFLIVYYIGYMTIEDLSHIKFSGVNCLYLIIENKHLTSVPTDESKETLKNMKNFGIKSGIILDH